MTRRCRVSKGGVKVDSNCVICTPRRMDIQLSWKTQEVGQVPREKKRFQFGCLVTGTTAREMNWKLWRDVLVRGNFAFLSTRFWWFH